MKQHEATQTETNRHGLLQVDDIAKELGVSTYQVRTWITNGHLQRLPNSHTIYVTRYALQEFLMAKAGAA